MEPKQEEHLHLVLREILKRTNEKYTKGQKEHGGNLWEKENLLDEAIDEVIDLAVYLITLKNR